MIVRRHLRLAKRDRFRSADQTDLSRGEARAGPFPNGKTRLQIGQAESVLAIAAIGRADQREERAVCRDAQ